MGNYPHNQNPIGKQTKVASTSGRKLMIIAGVAQLCRDSDSQSAASDLCPEVFNDVGNDLYNLYQRNLKYPTYHNCYW